MTQRHFAYHTTPQRVVFGTNCLQQLANEVRKAGWSRVLLVSSPHYARAGIVERVSAQLGDSMVGTFTNTAPHVPESHLDDALALARIHQADAVLALGGGSPIGLAKAVAHARRAESNQDVASAAIPTTYSGSEMTPVYGVTRTQADGSTRKATVRDTQVAPRLVLYDPQLTCALPAELTASTGVNALAHGIEAMYSRTSNPLSSAAAYASIALIVRALPECVQRGHDLNARSKMLEGAHLGGVALATVDMGLHHGTGHVLGGSAGVPHGVANCIVLPHAVRFNAEVCAAPLSHVAEAMGLPREGRSDDAMAHAVADALHRFIAKLGQPQRLRDVRVAREQLPALADALLASNAVVNNPRPLGSHEEALSYLEGMW